jgi:hypothetical protein
MCYFHLRFNLRQHKEDYIQLNLYDSVMGDVSKLRECVNQQQYDHCLNETLAKWRSRDDLKNFADYFVKQWVESDFSRWPIFQTPPGLAQTNSPIESFNNTIKQQFTKRLKNHIVSSLEIFVELIQYESTKDNLDFMVPKIPKAMKDQALQITNKLVKTSTDCYEYKHYDGSIGSIDVKMKTCTCFKYMDKMVCKHLIAASKKRLIFMVIQ